MGKRAPEYQIIDGEECALVALDKRGKKGRATLYKSDLVSLQIRGFSTNWRLSGENVIVSQAGNDNVPVAKAIMDPPDGYKIKYKNGNRKDLRSKNLELVPGKGRKRPRISQRKVRRSKLDPERIKIKDPNEAQLAELLAANPDIPVDDGATIDAGDVVQDNAPVARKKKKFKEAEIVAIGHLSELGKIMIEGWIADKHHAAGLPDAQYSMSPSYAKRRFGYTVKRFGKM